MYDDQQQPYQPEPQQYEAFDYDAFLRHSGTASGGGFLKDWKKEGMIDVWLPPNIAPYPRWMHRFWHIYEGRPRNAERGADKENLIGSLRWNCLEREQILKKQKFRVQGTDDLGRVNGEREYPPIDCPHCLLLEWVRTEIRERRLQTDTPIWALDTGKEDLVVLAGSWTGIHSSKPENLPDYVRDAMHAAGVQQDEVFQEVGVAQLDYVARFVEAADPGAGMLVTSLAPALGALVQKAIRDRVMQTARSQHRYDPRTDWLLLHLEYDKNKDFDRRYGLVPLVEDRPTPAVIETLNAVPKIADEVRPGDPRELLAAMQAAARIEIPWAQFFDRAIERFDRGEPWGGPTPTQAAPPPHAPPQQPRQAPYQPPQPAQRPAYQPPPQQAYQPPPRAPQAAPPAQAAPYQPPPQQAYQPPPAAAPPPRQTSLPTPPPQPAGDTCDVCGTPMGAGDTECGHCGARYDPFSFQLVYDPRTAPAAATNGAPPAAAPKAPAPASPPQQAAPAAAAMPPARPSARRGRGAPA